MKSHSFLKRTCILFVSGAIGGTAGDLCHVLSKTDGYPLSAGPQIPWLGVPFWVPFLFGAAGLTIGLSHPGVDRLSGTSDAPRPGLRNVSWLTAGVLMLFETWALSGFWGATAGTVKDAVLASLALITWSVFDRTASGLGLALATGALGTCLEILQTHAGTFYYTAGNQNLYGVPSWLPWIYCCASVATGNLGRVLERGFTRASSAVPDPLASALSDLPGKQRISRPAPDAP